MFLIKGPFLSNVIAEPNEWDLHDSNTVWLHYRERTVMVLQNEYNESLDNVVLSFEIKLNFQYSQQWPIDTLVLIFLVSFI